MAEFLRLKIRGIRSVGDDESNAHYIEFLKPCTLIAGPNGTGKTTIIEAMNYITTGVLPLGNYSTFVQSIEMAQKTRVDASITLEFLDVKRRKCTAVRRMTASLKNSKSTYGKDEFTLSIKHPDGTERSISSKAVDFDRVMLNHLGVPKAILNYVIFCHQEESTWPLSEPKELKKKFDEIFELTKFVTAQDHMRKMVTGYKKDKLVILERRRRCEDMIKIKYEAKKVFDECTEKKNEMRAKLDEMTQMQTQLINEKAQLEKQISHIEKTLKQYEQKEFELKTAASNLQVLRVPSYHGAEEQLRNEIQEIENDGQVRSIEAERQNCKVEIDRIVQNLHRITNEKRKLEDLISQMMADAKHRDSIVEEINKMEEQLRSELNINSDTLFIEALQLAIDEKQLQLAEILES
ncbi:unnamed protein product [Caenorhabditis bovis]|uniref:Rad50/SbcC-type AAA domain-containing protein n=1 Tax=Caenorhabditis bovis TaxID=2654633 RepID=A0A8S1EDI9_9PELO|nr:unnamed protein product [Caenorhabditis bovis]